MGKKNTTHLTYNVRVCVSVCLEVGEIDRPCEIIARRTSARQTYWIVPY